MTENIFDVVNETEEIERITAERNYLQAICDCHKENSFDEFEENLSEECVLKTYEGNEVPGKDEIIQYLNQIQNTSFERGKLISYNAGLQLPVFDEVSDYGFGKHCLVIGDNNHYTKT